MNHNYPVRLHDGEAPFARALTTTLVRSTLLLIMVSVSTTTSVFAQESRTPEISGLLFADYDYTVTSPDGDLDGTNGFGYRRAYLTFDYTVSDRIDSRLRFESADNRTTGDGLPAPFVKDLYLKASDFPAAGHSATFGLHPTPNFRVSEDVWGYRSLEKTVQDRAGVVGSRDMGISFTGPIAAEGAVRYRFMAANNSGVRAESDKFKRMYAAVEYRSDSPLRASVGGDYYRFETGTSTNLFAFVGVATETSAAGFEIFSNVVDHDDGPEPITSGLSIFGSFSHAVDRTVIGRIDLTGVGERRLSSDVGYALVGYSFGFDDHVEIIPNLEYWFADGSEESTLRARLTVSARL